MQGLRPLRAGSAPELVDVVAPIDEQTPYRMIERGSSSGIIMAGGHAEAQATSASATHEVSCSYAFDGTNQASKTLS